MYKGQPVTHSQLKSTYKLLTEEDALSEEWLQAPILVSTNRERYTLLQEKARIFAAQTGRRVIRWMRKWKKWEQQPPDEFLSGAMEDPVFWEHFVDTAAGFVNVTIQKELLLVNALPVVYRAIKFEEEYEDLFQHLLATTAPGDIIDMPVPPITIIVEVQLPKHIDDTVRSALQEMSLPGATRYGAAKGAILLPIQRVNARWDATPVVIRGSTTFLPSKALFSNFFPLELGFAITVHKSQGKTLERVVISLSDCGVPRCRFTFRQLLVALSRVQCSEHIRLFLSGATEMEKWKSILFVGDLRRSHSIAYFFAGFRDIDEGDVNDGWMQDAWCPKRANEKFKGMLDGGIL